MPGKKRWSAGVQTPSTATPSEGYGGESYAGQRVTAPPRRIPRPTGITRPVGENTPPSLPSGMQQRGMRQTGTPIPQSTLRAQSPSTGCGWVDASAEDGGH